MMAREDVPFKFKAIINSHIAKDTDLGKTISTHVLEIDPNSFTYRIFEQLKVMVRVCYKTQRSGLFGGKKEKWVHKTCPIKLFCTEYRDQVKAHEIVIEDISISKLALMVINI